MTKLFEDKEVIFKLSLISLDFRIVGNLKKLNVGKNKLKYLTTVANHDSNIFQLFSQINYFRTFKVTKLFLNLYILLVYIQVVERFTGAKKEFGR